MKFINPKHGIPLCPFPSSINHQGGGQTQERDEILQGSSLLKYTDGVQKELSFCKLLGCGFLIG